MNELLMVVGCAAVLYAMKAIPIFIGRLPQTRFVATLLDLLPVGLLMALLIPPVLANGFDQPGLEGLFAMGGVVAALVLSALTGQAAIGIGAGLALLAVAELL